MSSLTHCTSQRDVNVPTHHTLAGISVLLTRPATQAVGIAQAIHNLGGNVVSLPLLEIEAITERVAVEKLKSSIMALDNYDAAIFISTNAATLGVEWIENYWPQLPLGIEAYAVGPGTAEILRKLPWQVHCSDTGVTSEDLLALPGLLNVKDKRIALFRGQGGRELIAESLRTRGARVDYLELYARTVPQYSRDEVLQQIEREGINVVVTTSMQVLDSFLHLIDTATVSSELLRRLSVIVPSQRVREHALAAGFKHVINAGGADDQTVLRSLQQLQSASATNSEAM